MLRTATSWSAFGPRDDTTGGVPVAERLAGIAERAGATLIDVNTRDNQLRQLAMRRGSFIEGRASIAMQAIAQTVAEAAIAVDRWPGRAL